MKEVCGTARNILLCVGSDGSLAAFVEAAITVSEPQFTVDDGGELVKSRVTETIRFCSTPNGLRTVAEDFLKWADSAEAALKATESEESDV